MLRGSYKPAELMVKLRQVEYSALPGGDDSWCRRLA
jgi:hypothetical protein